MAPGGLFVDAVTGYLTISPQQPQYQTQQPMPTGGMQVGGGNRNAAGKPLDSNSKRDTCCYACWCPWIVHGKNKQRLSHLADTGFPDPDGGACCSGSCWGHCLLTSLIGGGWILQCLNRGDTRGRYGIQGGGCGDCCTSFCCHSCDLVQVSREIMLEEKSSGERY
ncbi:PLAC8 family-domain-containing protein [Mycena olivaceomarginata]|nr:PLAC8 family-domain-containing protein [Mycena olivaceomarginata]